MTINVSAIDGGALPFTLRGVDRGTGSADSVAGKVVTLTHHDDLFKAAFDSFYGIGLTKVYYSAAISTSGNNTLVAAPGTGNRISVAWFRLANESATEVTVLITSGANQRFRAVLGPKGTAGQSVEMSFPVHMPLEMGVNTALVINISSAVAVGVSLAYHVRS